ncbi:MAG: retropepsin-like aspartic protease [Terricaulis sp.]
MVVHRAFQAEFAGHHIPAKIHRDSLQSLDEGQAPYIPSNALVDTGASFVFIDPSVAVALRLKHIDNGEIDTVGQRVGCLIYSGILEIEELRFKERLNLWAPNVRRMSYQIVLGREFLKNFVVTFDGPKDCMIIGSTDHHGDVFDRESHDG